jgi:hypothetical protein
MSQLRSVIPVPNARWILLGKGLLASLESYQAVAWVLALCLAILAAARLDMPALKVALWAFVRTLAVLQPAMLISLFHRGGLFLIHLV